MHNEWSDEILIPGANLEAYARVYEAETWLRRVALTALLLADGPAWATKIDSSLRGRLQAQSKTNAARWVLGIDAEEELLWSATLGQLAQVLATPAIADQVAHVTGTTGQLLADRLQSIGQVRNALAHNRAISDDTLAVLSGDLVTVRSAVRRFKSMTLYAQSKIITSTAPSDLRALARAFEFTAQSLPAQQLFLSANDDFAMLVRLPVEPYGRWPRVGRVRELLGMSAHLLLCILIHKEGDELQLTLPRALPSAEKLTLLERFIVLVSDAEAWTDTPPDAQHPASASWPRAWYYENRPEHE